MGKKLKTLMTVFLLVFLLSLVIDAIETESDLFYQEAVAPTREFHENVTILANNFSVLNLQFQQGDELELIYSLEVRQQGKVIDVWFVNYANYAYLVKGIEFYFFIDGSAQEVSKATKIVSVTQHDAYALVLANYNNVSVDVYLNYDVNVYPLADDTTPVVTDKGEEIPLWKEYYIMLPLGLVIGIIVGLLVSRLFGKSGKKEPKPTKKPPTKTQTKAPKKKVKVKKKVPKETKAAPVEKTEDTESKEGQAEAAEKVPSPTFCGNCGSPVTTKFCQNCGKEVGKT
jgi:hypothetical protein